MVEKIVVSFLLLVIGGALVYYSAQLTQLFGRWPWADRYLGGTRAAYILMGFVLIVIGFMILFGGFDYKGGLRMPIQNTLE